MHIIRTNNVIIHTKNVQKYGCDALNTNKNPGVISVYFILVEALIRWQSRNQIDVVKKQFHRIIFG